MTTRSADMSSRALTSRSSFYLCNSVSKRVNEIKMMILLLTSTLLFINDDINDADDIDDVNNVNNVNNADANDADDEKKENRRSKKEKNHVSTLVSIESSDS
jgi:hypothetical protein